MLRRILPIDIIRLTGLLFLLTLAPRGSIAAASDQQGNQPLMSPAIGSVAPAPVDARNGLMAQLHFNTLGAVVGGLSLCEGDQNCIKKANEIQSWVCAAGICEGGDKTKEPTTCFGGIFSKYSVQDQAQISTLICPVIKSPGPLTRQALLARISQSDANEDDLVESVAYLLAIKQSASACEDYIKDYVGPYGPKWKFDWYRALSGCRILAHERTAQQEESDFYTWFGVAQGIGNCSGLINNEMRNACNTPGAGSPVP